MYARNNPLFFVDPNGETYVVSGPNGSGTLLDEVFLSEKKHFEGLGFIFTGNGTFFESGNIISPDGKVVASYQQVSIDDNLQRFSFQMSRHSVASLKLIDIAANITLTPISIISGTGLFRAGAGLTTLGLKGAAEAANAIEGGRLLAQAASTVGNQKVRASSRAVAEQAARDWVGQGARNIVDRQTGQVVGKISADGSKIARYTSAGKAEPYINLVDKLTGGNLHVRF